MTAEIDREIKAHFAAGPVDPNRRFRRETGRMFKRPPSSLDDRVTQRLFELGKQAEEYGGNDKALNVLEGEGDFILGVAEELGVIVNWDKLNESIRRVKVTRLRR